MEPREAAKVFGALYANVYQYLHPRRSATDYRPSPESLAVLQHLAMSGPLSVQEAARHFDRSQAAMSEMIERLVQRGMLERMKDESDRRRNMVWLTEEGQRVTVAESQPLDEELLAAALDHLDADQREVLIDSLRALAEAAATIPDRGDDR